MCTEATHNEEPKASVAPTAQPTTAVIAGKPMRRVYQVNGSTLTFKNEEEVYTNASLATSLNDYEVAYYFNERGVPTHKREIYGSTKEVQPNDVIFQQDFMKNQAPVSNTTPVITVSTFLASDLKNPINTKTADDMAKAKRMLSRGMSFGEVRYLFVDGKPTRKRVYEGDSVDVEHNDPIFTILTPVNFELRWYKIVDLSTTTRTANNVSDLDHANWPDGLFSVSPSEILYVFSNNKPIKKRTYETSLVDVKPDDPIFTALKPKVTEPTPAATPEPKFVAKVLDSNDLTQIIRQVNVKNERSLGDSKTGTLRSAKEIFYLFKDDQPIKLRKFMQSEQDVTSTDPIWAALKPKVEPTPVKKIVGKIFKKNDLSTPTNVNMPQEPAKPVANVETEKPATVQEFLAEVMKRHQTKNYRLLSNEAFNDVVKEMWPEKAGFIFNTGDKTTYYMMLQLLSEWNPPAKKKNKKYNFGVHKLRHDFIIEAARLVNTSNPSDKLVESIESFGKATSMFIGDWQSDIRVVLAKHFNNPLWLKNGVFTANNESYELEQIDMVIT